MCVPVSKVCAWLSEPRGYEELRFGSTESCNLKQTGPVLWTRNTVTWPQSEKVCLTSSLGTSSCLLSNSELHWSLFLIHKLGQLCRLYEVWVIQYQHPSNRVVVLSYKPFDENEQQFSFLAPHSMQKVMQKATSPVRRTERNRWKISKSRNLAKKWSKYITWSSSKTLTQYLSASRLNCLCTSHFIHSITQSLLLGLAILKS